VPCETAVEGDGERWWGGVGEVVAVVGCTLQMQGRTGARAVQTMIILYFLPYCNIIILYRIQEIIILS